MVIGRERGKVRTGSQSMTTRLSLPQIKSGRIDGVGLRDAGRPRCGQPPELHATLVHPCSPIGACAPHCNIVGAIQQLAQVLLAEHHDMIKALPSDRAFYPGHILDEICRSSSAAFGEQISGSWGTVEDLAVRLDCSFDYNYRYLLNRYRFNADQLAANGRGCG